MKLTFEYNGQPFPLDLTPNGRVYTAELNGRRYTVQILRAAAGRLTLRLSELPSVSESVPPSGSVRLSTLESVDDSVSAHISLDGPRRWVTVGGRTYLITKSAAGRRAGGHAHYGAGELTAPMPGQVRAVHVSQGESVIRGQTLLILEAMKMEIRIQSPADGIVQSLRVQPGQTVERDQVLIMLGEK